MKRKLILRIFTIALTLALLMAALPLAPVSAAVGVIALPSTGSPGQVIPVFGSGFAVGSTYVVTFNYATRATGTVDSSGNFTTNFTVPFVPRNPYTPYPVTVTTDGPDTANTILFEVTPRITLSTNTGFVGDTVIVNGSGFQANETVSIVFDTTSLTTADANSLGVISNIEITVPESTKGTHTIKSIEGGVSSPTVNFSTKEEIIIDPVEGGVGDTVLVTGTGFAAGDAIDILFDDVVQSSVTATSDDKGSFSVSMTIPSTSRGSHTIKARDEALNSATATLTIGHKIAIPDSDDPNGFKAGDTLAISGNGFDANKTITITWNDTVITTSPAAVTTNSEGVFNASITIPGTLADTYLIEVSDGVNNTTIDVTVRSTASISQTTTQASPGHVGMELTISGTGYAAGTITVIYGTTTLATTTSDAAAFSTTFTIPESSGGSYIIKVSDSAGTSKQWEFFMEEQAPTAPALTLPEEATKAEQPVIFDWQDVTDESGVTYTFQLSTDVGFALLVLEQTGLTASDFALTETQELESVSGDAPYHWRVKSIDGAANESAWSAGTFTVGFTLDLPLWAIIALSVAGSLGLLALGFWLGRRSVSY